jgi:site-specific recombinase XerD
MSTKTTLPTLLRGFFETYLAGQRDVSPNTIFAYRDSIKLLLRFVARRTGRQVIRLQVDDLGSDTVLAFLAYLEAERKNCAATRNCRLIAVHRFFAYVADVDPQHAELCRRVLNIPIKKTVSSAMTYLERDEMKALLDVPRPSHWHGLRDSALLTLLYNTGARASEAVGLNIRDVRFETPALIHILGKGRKERACPIWPETVKALQAYLKQRDDGDRLDAPLFLNAHGRRLGRFGIVAILKRHIATAAKQRPSLAAKRISPHTLRHTAAMHLLQSGVETNVIKSWLGHVSVTTTNEYIEIDMAMKREAIERCTPPVPEPIGDIPWRSRQDIIEWLEDL